MLIFMKFASIYKTKAEKRIIQESYENYLKLFDVPFERIYVETRYGKTHTLVTGPKEGKPLFILQGGNSINPMTLAWFESMLKEYRVYAPDTIGHPGFSDEMRLSRSEEHTSELQSRFDLVCRLLLEKKKIEDSNQYCTI